MGGQRRARRRAACVGHATVASRHCGAGPVALDRRESTDVSSGKSPDGHARREPAH
jgi:hypothetical protein